MTNLTRAAAVLALMSLFVPTGGPATAEETTAGEAAALREEIDELRQRLLELEARLEADEPVAEAAPAAELYDPPAAVPPPADELAAADETETAEALPRSRNAAFLPSRGWLEGMYYGIPGLNVGVHAFIDLEFVDAGPDGARDGNSFFDTHHANIFVQAQLRPNLLAHAEFEFEHSDELIEVDQAYVAWAATDFLTLEAGRFYAPFGIERFVWYSPTNLLVSRPEPMRQIIPGNFYANGVMAAGLVGPEDGHRFSYEVALSNGLGSEVEINRRASRQSRDNNDDKAITGRVAWIPTRNFEVGASYHGQRYDDADRLDFTAYGLDVASRWRGWQLRGEYIDAGVERLGAPELEQSGWYGQLGYTFSWLRERLPDLTLVTRYDVVDLDGAVVGNDDRELWSVGVNASIFDHFRFKAEYRFVSEDGPVRDDDVVYGQFVVDF